MFDSVNNKFLFYFPLLGGCFLIGAISSFLGALFLVYTLYTLPLEKLAYYKNFNSRDYTIFLTTLIIYYVGLIFSGYQTMHGVIKRKPTKMIPMLAALIVHPLMGFSYNYVYSIAAESFYYNNEYRVPNTILLYNGSLIFVSATFVAGYFALCIINGIRMIENGQKYRESSILYIEKLNFKTFFGFLSLETGALSIATTSVIFGAAFTFSLFKSAPYFSFVLFDIFYYISMSIVSLFYAALVIGGILLAKGVEQKDPKKMKPLMTTFFVQPALLFFFYMTYCSNYNYGVDSGMGTLYLFLTILFLYFGFCIRNLLKTNGYEPEVFNDISYERIEYLDDVTFDASNPLVY